MSSGVRPEMGRVRRMLGSLAEKLGGGGRLGSKESQTQVNSRIARLGLTPRQQDLNHLWSWYRCQRYEARRCDWDGKQNLDPIEHEAVATAGFIPPGFYDAGALLPIKFRRPRAPYALPKVIVDRFTGLLFSERHHPQIRVEGDPDTEDFIAGVAESARLWAIMILARSYGGAMGTTVVGFQFVDGVPVVEAHDPRWCTPDFLDKTTHKLRSVEKRYMFTEELKDPSTGVTKPVDFWYRRVIDEQKDTLFKQAPVGDGGEPEWGVEKEVVHGFGFCPVYWVQNLPVQEDIDGDPDCTGVYDLIESMDALLSQAMKGTLANCFGRETQFITYEGVRAFSDYVDGASITVLTHKGAWKPALVKCFGKQSLYAVVLQRGTRGRPVTVRATRDHRWLLEDGSETTTLQVGDRLLPAPVKFREFDYATADAATRAFWRRGFIWGDGSARTTDGATYGCSARLCGRKAVYLSRFIEGGFRVSYPPSACGEPVVACSENLKSLPPLDTPLNLLRAFVRGYVDADGTRSRKASTRWSRIQVTGQASVNFVRTIFPAVGLYITCEAPVVGATNYGERTTPTVRFELNENASEHFNSAWRVVSIEQLREEEVWCLQTQDDRSIVLPIGVASGQCDPTVVITTKESLGSLSKGSDNAIKLPDGTASYMEMSGAGIQRAMEQITVLRQFALEVAQCVLEHPDQAKRTATEIERSFASMLAKADVLREQYGERGIKPMILDMVKVARKLGQGSVDEQGNVVKQVFNLPPRIVKNEDGSMTQEPRKLGVGGVLKIQWPHYFDPMLSDVNLAVTSAGHAKLTGLIDEEHAVKFTAEYFGVEDVQAMLKKIKAETKDREAVLEAQMMGQSYAAGVPGGSGF